MKNKILTTLTAILAVACLTAATDPWKQQFTEQERVDFICNVLYLDKQGPDSINCSAIETPKIEVARYPGYQWRSVRGWYSSSYPNTIFVSEWMVDAYGMDSFEVESVILHEMTHYVDTQYRAYPWSKDGCWTEANAWHIGQAYWIYRGQPDIAKDYHKWWTWYGCNRPGPLTGGVTF